MLIIILFSVFFLLVNCDITDDCDSNDDNFCVDVAGNHVGVCNSCFSNVSAAIYAIFSLGKTNEKTIILLGEEGVVSLLNESVEIEDLTPESSLEYHRIVVYENHEVKWSTMGDHALFFKNSTNWIISENKGKLTFATNSSQYFFDVLYPVADGRISFGPFSVEVNENGGFGIGRIQYDSILGTGSITFSEITAIGDSTNYFSQSPFQLLEPDGTFQRDTNYEKMHFVLEKSRFESILSSTTFLIESELSNIVLDSNTIIVDGPLDGLVKLESHNGGTLGAIVKNNFFCNQIASLDKLIYSLSLTNETNPGDEYVYISNNMFDLIGSPRLFLLGTNDTNIVTDIRNNFFLTEDDNCIIMGQLEGINGSCEGEFLYNFFAPAECIVSNVTRENCSIADGGSNAVGSSVNFWGVGDMPFPNKKLGMDYPGTGTGLGPAYSLPPTLDMLGRERKSTPSIGPIEYLCPKLCGYITGEGFCSGENNCTCTSSYNSGEECECSLFNHEKWNGSFCNCLPSFKFNGTGCDCPYEDMIITGTLESSECVCDITKYKQMNGSKCDCLPSFIFNGTDCTCPVSEMIIVSNECVCDPSKYLILSDSQECVCDKSKNFYLQSNGDCGCNVTDYWYFDESDISCKQEFPDLVSCQGVKETDTIDQETLEMGTIYNGGGVIFAFTLRTSDVKSVYGCESEMFKITINSEEVDLFTGKQMLFDSTQMNNYFTLFLLDYTDDDEDMIPIMVQGVLNSIYDLPDGHYFAVYYFSGFSHPRVIQPITKRENFQNYTMFEKLSNPDLYQDKYSGLRNLYQSIYYSMLALKSYMNQLCGLRNIGNLVIFVKGTNDDASFQGISQLTLINMMRLFEEYNPSNTKKYYFYLITLQSAGLSQFLLEGLGREMYFLTDGWDNVVDSFDQFSKHSKNKDNSDYLLGFCPQNGYYNEDYFINLNGTNDASSLRFTVDTELVDYNLCSQNSLKKFEPYCTRNSIQRISGDIFTAPVVFQNEKKEFSNTYSYLTTSGTPFSFVCKSKKPTEKILSVNQGYIGAFGGDDPNTGLNEGKVFTYQELDYKLVGTEVFVNVKSPIQGVEYYFEHQDISDLEDQGYCYIHLGEYVSDLAIGKEASIFLIWMYIFILLWVY